MRWVTRTNSTSYAAANSPFACFLMLLVAVGMLGGAAWTGKNTYALVSQGIHVDGKISGVKSSLETSTRTRNGYKETVTETKYRYTVAFTDKNGTEHEFQDSMVTSSPQHTAGDVVPVLFLESDPQKSASIDHGMLNWFLPGVLGLMGLVFAAGGGLALKGLKKPANALPL